MQALLSLVIGAVMRARRHVLTIELAAIAAVGLAVTGCSAPATRSVAGQVATGPGARLWLSRFAGPGHARDKASAVAISPDGTTAYVTGTFGWSGLPTPHENYGTAGYESAQHRWRAVNAPHLVALVRAGASFRDGVLAERPEQTAA